MLTRLDRRTILGAALLAPALAYPARAGARQDESDTATFSYPIGLPGQLPGDGFLIRHGFTTENTWYLPGHWHTGEDWYAIDGDTAGAAVLAIGDGEVVFAGSEYPGRVVIVRHEPDLYSMYGHLDPALSVAEGETVTRGQILGTVLDRGDDIPNHLHVEVRTFFTTAEVNGATPRYGFQCGPDCLPGPGYWPIDAPDLPADQGWLNPTHFINDRAFPAPTDASDSIGSVVVARDPSTDDIEVWSAPENDAGATRSGTLPPDPGATFPLLAMDSGDPESTTTGADAYDVWYQVETPLDGPGWVRAVTASDIETGGDGRPSAVRVKLVPEIDIVTE